jgi:putative endonuclease
MTESMEAALNREKQIKGWTRRKKLDLIAEMNPDWRDISDDWREDGSTSF